MIDIYNEKLEKYDDGTRHVFTATFLQPNDRQAIFTDLKVDSMDEVVVNKIAMHYTKAFKDLDLNPGDVIQFEGLVKKDNQGGFSVERPTQAEKIQAAPAPDSNVHVMGNDWNWFEN
ncbi:MULTISPECIES: hypothetical protein [Lactobacillus]|uniref:Uncharacterized protein n=1 Tax=Lactobacillus xujianguonis TaxID=2495899 RepID=A0A437SUZ5_9LACO|nr:MULTISPECIES: hypothetical protein [Lactobacillus]RVU70745.1 hypothetical protein EJK17_05730 [Lactobacillus xujianguonis]RVU73994.1 hypothetical protein EJK20_05485 [Lactobacillus xujianguonis]